MAGWRDLGNIWTTFRQLDIRPIQEEAERPVILAFIGPEGAGKSTLVAALRHDARQREKVITPTVEADISAAEQMAGADLIVLVLDATCAEFADEAKAYREWTQAGRNVVVLYNKMDAVREPGALLRTGQPWSGRRVAYGSALD